MITGAALTIMLTWLQDHLSQVFCGHRLFHQSAYLMGIPQGIPQVLLVLSYLDWSMPYSGCLGLSLSDFKHLCIPLLKITVALQDAGFFHDVHGVTKMRNVLIGIVGRTGAGLELQFVLESFLMTPPHEEEGRRERSTAFGISQELRTSVSLWSHALPLGKYLHNTSKCRSSLLQCTNPAHILPSLSPLSPG